MVRRTINIPLYGCKVYVVFAPDTNEESARICKKLGYRRAGGSNYAEVIGCETVHAYYILYSTDHLTLNILVHEVTHLGGLILKDRGYNQSDDEPLAYLNGYLAGELENIMIRNNIPFIQKPTRGKSKTRIPDKDGTRVDGDESQIPS